MNKAFIVICFCILNSDLLFSQAKNMDNSNHARTVLLRIGGVTIGINRLTMGLSDIVFQDKAALIGERTNGGYYMIANAEFTPNSVSPHLIKDLREAVLFLPIVTDRNDSTQLEKFYSLPGWMSLAENIECLTLDRMNLADFHLINGTNLKFLVLNKVEFENRDKLIRNIMTLRNLTYLVHDLAITPNEVKMIKSAIPALNVLLVEEYEAGLESGAIKRP